MDLLSGVDGMDSFSEILSNASLPPSLVQRLTDSVGRLQITVDHLRARRAIWSLSADHPGPKGAIKSDNELILKVCRSAGRNGTELKRRPRNTSKNMQSRFLVLTPKSLQATGICPNPIFSLLATSDSLEKNFVSIGTKKGSRRGQNGSLSYSGLVSLRNIA